MRWRGSAELHHRHSQVLKHRRNTAKGPPGLAFTFITAHALGVFQDSPGLGKVGEVCAGDNGVGKQGVLSWPGHSLVQKPRRDGTNVFLPECEPLTSGNRQDGPPLASSGPLERNSQNF